MLQFGEEISKKSSSVFCKEIVLKEGKEKFGEDINLNDRDGKGICVSAAKKILSNLNGYDKDTFIQEVSSALKPNNDIDKEKAEKMFQRHIQKLRTFVEEEWLPEELKPVLDRFEKDFQVILKQYDFD